MKGSLGNQNDSSRAPRKTPYLDERYKKNPFAMTFDCTDLNTVWDVAETLDMIARVLKG